MVISGDEDNMVERFVEIDARVFLDDVSCVHACACTLICVYARACISMHGPILVHVRACACGRVLCLCGFQRLSYRKLIGQLGVSSRR